MTVRQVSAQAKAVSAEGRTTVRDSRLAKQKPPRAELLGVAMLAEWTGLEPATPGVTGTHARIRANGSGLGFL